MRAIKQHWKWRVCRARRHLLWPLSKFCLNVNWKGPLNNDSFIVHDPSTNQGGWNCPQAESTFVHDHSPNVIQDCTSNRDWLHRITGDGKHWQLAKMSRISQMALKDIHEARWTSLNQGFQWSWCPFAMILTHTEVWWGCNPIHLTCHNFCDRCANVCEVPPPFRSHGSDGN